MLAETTNFHDGSPQRNEWLLLIADYIRPPRERQSSAHPFSCHKELVRMGYLKKKLFRRDIPSALRNSAITAQINNLAFSGIYEDQTILL